DLDLMEDLAMSKRLSGLGRVAVAPRSVRVSGRRFESAPLYQTALVNIFPLLYALGVSPRTLARLYGNPR
ncbi:MAG: glycosyltransferase, partial [Myxococcota bacterium]